MSGVGVTNDYDISAADGVTTVFTYTFFAYDTSQVKVYSVLDDVETEITTGITITPNTSFIGGTVTFSTAPAAAVGDILRRRDVPYTQTTEFTDLTRYKETAIEKAFNTLVMQIQQVYSKISRSIKYTEASGLSGGGVIEAPTDGSLLAFDGTSGKIKGVTVASLGLSGLDTVLTSPTADDGLFWNGTNWVNKNIAQVSTGPIASVASATTVVLNSTTTNYFNITGTTTITGITLAEGVEVTVKFAGALTLTNGANLINISGADITTAAGDIAVFRGEASGVVRMISYERASGAPISGAIKSCLAAKTGNQSIPNTTLTALTWDAEGFDVGSWHDNVTNNSRFVVPTGITRARVNVNMQVNSGAYNKFLYVRKNGSSICFMAGTEDTSSYQNYQSPLFDVAAGDYIEVYFYHNNGSSVTITAGTAWGGGTATTWCQVEGF